MSRTILLGAILCCVAPPALAGDRDRDHKPLPADAAALLVRDQLPTARVALAASPSFVLMDAAKHPRIVTTIEIGPQPLPSRFAWSDPQALPDWHLTGARPQVTAMRGGSWAVRDTFSRERRPRAFRPDATVTMLTLKLDADKDAPTFNIRGGGVSSMLWAVVPKQ